MQTHIGGLKARDKNLAKDPDYYKKMGAEGGKNSNTGGFASKKIGADGLTGKERARLAGASGGRVSRRGKFEPQISSGWNLETVTLEPKKKKFWIF